jgi:hypothetical protein
MLISGKKNKFLVFHGSLASPEDQVIGLLEHASVLPREPKNKNHQQMQNSVPVPPKLVGCGAEASPPSPAKGSSISQHAV